MAGCKTISADTNRRVPNILLVGDSLTVGPFGERLETWLLQGGGKEHVAVYGSCGSSVEHWLSSEPVFMTPCGYRETHNSVKVIEIGRNGRRPSPMPTPKIEKLLTRHRPQLLIIQLGTNHFSNLKEDGPEVIPKLAARYEAFAQAIRANSKSLRRVVWITPPDSAKFSSKIEKEIQGLIVGSAKRHGFRLIDSSQLTKYTSNTGSDGVHYGKEEGYAWADAVIRQLNVSLDR